MVGFCIVILSNDTHAYILVWSHVHHVLVCKKKRRDQKCVYGILLFVKKMCVYERMSSEGYMRN